MFHKIREWIKKRTSEEQFHLICLGTILVIFIIFYLGMATFTRYQYIKYYDKGVQLYEEKRYEEALPIFRNLINWKIGKRDGEEMYTKTLAKVDEISVIAYCPECHQMVSIDYLPLEERP